MRGAVLATCIVQVVAFQPAPSFFGLHGRLRAAGLHPLAPQRHLRGASYAQLDAAIDAKTGDKVAKTGDKVSHVFDVFIEDTDCFGVVYNANYLKFFDRARQDALGVRQV